MRAGPGLFPTLADGQNALLAPPEDPHLLAEAVTRVMTEPGLRQRLSSASAALSRAFEWDTIARRHLEVYRGLEVT
jgi:glycosyltransferase involved in cell wall biosynthesis